jgi:hypothetical protein
MLALVVVEEHTTAGAVVHGRLEGSCESTPAAIALVRIEQSPAGRATFHVAAAELAADGSFALLVPADTPPEVAGRSCAMHYVLRATADAEELHQSLAVTG